MTIILLFVLYLLMTNPNVVSREVVNASYLWFSVLVPTMYPSFVILDMIAYMPLTNKICTLLYKPFRLIFHIQYKKSTFLILISLLCGAPASTKLIRSSYENHEISKKEYQNLICGFSTLSFPYTLMICSRLQISIVAYYFFLILLSILWMQVWNKKEKDIVEASSSYQKNYLEAFFNSVKKNIDILIHILGILVIFRVLITVLFKGDIIFYPFLEILGGLEITKNPCIALMAMGFLGISIHLQILYILEQFPYSKFLFSRILFSSLGLLSLS